MWAEPRTSEQDASRGSLRALEVIVAQVRQCCPQGRIIVRADSGFRPEDLMVWCEAQEQPVCYCLGLARNNRFCRDLEEVFFAAFAKAVPVGVVAGVFREFDYRTPENWSRARRVIGKAGALREKNNARIIFTNLPAGGFAVEERGRLESAALHEGFYCARGNMENQINQQQLPDLNADRMNTHFMVSNKLRLWLGTFVCFLVERLRALGLKGTSLEGATAGTIRLRLLKIGAWLTVSVRRVYIRLAGGFALQVVLKKRVKRRGHCHWRLPPGRFRGCQRRGQNRA